MKLITLAHTALIVALLALTSSSYAAPEVKEWRLDTLDRDTTYEVLEIDERR